jgi:hypothetical protein
MAEVVYVLCAFLSVACAGMLMRGFFRSRSQLLLWSSLCFVGLAINNVFLFVDMTLVPDVDLNGPLIRNALTAVSGSLLLFGLIWELT